MFNSYEQFLYPDALKELVVNDKEMQSIMAERIALENKYYQKIEDIRKANNLQYTSNNLPVWVKDSKFSKPYLKEDTAVSEGVDVSTNQS